MEVATINNLTIIGNLCSDPVLRTTHTQKNVCTFTVAVNRRARQGEDQKADFFRVNAWGATADNCQQYLAKGRKVAVTGAVSVSTYEAKDGSGTRATLEVLARDVEFLSPKGDTGAEDGFTVVDDEILPF